MAENKDSKVLSRINAELEKIDKKENRIYFFVIDTKGNPSGSLEYIYKLAYLLHEENYNVTMLYQEEEFVGVREWLGDKYADLPHEDIAKDEVNVSPSDILFIPELFSNIMTQTKSLPCKRVAILQNYNYVLEQIPMSVQWGDFGIMEAITNTDLNAELIKDIFPYIKTTTIKPYIDPMFGKTNTPKELTINIVAKDQTDINKIIKPFYWKYPMYKWVSFKDLRGFPKEHFANLLREGAITLWVDEDTNFGYTPLEAMKSGSIVIAKIPTEEIEWTTNENGQLQNCCVWFNTFHELHRIIASVVRGYITDNVPEELIKEADRVASEYTIENTKNSLIEYIEKTCTNRKTEIESVKKQVENNIETTKEVEND